MGPCFSFYFNMKTLGLFSIAVFIAYNSDAQIIDSAKRKVALQGAVNFRDIGGYKTQDGHYVKWGEIYRSADMSKLTSGDLAVLEQKNITYDVDLRGNQEAKQAPDRLNPNTNYILCPAGSDNVNSNMMQSLKTIKIGGDSVMISYYSNTTYLADRYKPFFNKLLNLPNNQSLVFHCMAGKDRTGIAAALLLYALGVQYDTIVQDYVASNYYRKAENEKAVYSMVYAMQVDEKVAKDVLSVKKEYLDATFNAIKIQYGSVDSFLKDQIGLDNQKIKLLKKKFLE